MNDFLHYAIEKAEVISFDVYDTLLLRSCGKPTDVFITLEKESSRKGFACKRILAERKACRRAAGMDQVSLEEIYSYIPKYADIREREIQFERETVKANAEVVEIWNEVGRLGKRRIICSDMYLSGHVIGELLQRNGISGWDALYVSSDRKATKSSGKLYDIILGEMGVEASKILHIGDNAQSDIRQANQKGIVAFQYCRGVDSGIMRPFATRIAWAKVVEDGWRKFGPSDYWNRIGYVYAGVLGYAYARFIGEESKRLGITRLLLVYRDGYQLEPILNLLYPEIKTSLIYAPRVTYTLASQDMSRDPAMRRGFVWKRVGMKGGDAERERFVATGALSDENQRLFNQESLEAKREYEDYFSTLNVAPDEQVAVVDMTTGGFTSSHLVEMALNREITSFYLVCVRPWTDPLPKRMMPFYNAHASSAIFMWMSEFLFTGPTPTVREVRDKMPVYGSCSVFDEFKMSVCKGIRNSIMASAKELADHGVHISRGELLDYFEQFHAALTARDDSEFSFAREANNLEQNNYVSPFHRELRQIRPLIKLLGRCVINYKNFVRGGGVIQRFIFGIFRC